jgi:hypothetical protein
MEIFAPHAQIALADPGTGGTSWQVSTKRGTQSGVGVDISGAGAWAKLTGQMSFSLKQLEKSTAYDSIKSQYNIGGGVSGFWAWLLGLSAGASQQREEVHQTFNEMESSQSVNGTVNVDLECTGLYPNVEVYALAFVMVLQITNSQGSSLYIASAGNPTGDTGAQDQNGNSVPTKNNNTSMTFS